MERIQLRKQLIKCCVFAISQLVIVSGTFILKSEKAEAAGNNLAISIANDYVNIRNKPSLNGKVKGRLYRGSAVYITRTYKNGWALIKSGNFRGYIKKEFLATGTKARQLARKYGVKYITVKKNVGALNVREKTSKKAKIITSIGSGESFYVRKLCGKSWVRISVDGEQGYVARNYVNLRVKYKHPVSIAQVKAEEKKQETTTKKDTTTTKNSTTTTKNSTTKKDSTTTTKDSTTLSDETDNTNDTAKKKVTGSQIANYAKKFLGNPYKYGGTSLTNGADCSGFTQSIYKEFGYDIPRTSLEQSAYGTKVSASSIKQGDLVFYQSGKTVGHVALYIGDGEVIHASNEKDGIKISKMNYRTPYCIRRIV
ncbi:NlpC/P60 family protein [Butyribacter intestini]|uniref:C40 family peptidase n=1 Tax=Butyribacter intestini TaxID=1703332 RepID=UPI003AF11BED